MTGPPWVYHIECHSRTVRLVMAKQSKSELVFGKEVTSRPTAKTSTGTPLLRCSCPMTRRSITR